MTGQRRADIGQHPAAVRRTPAAERAAGEHALLALQRLVGNAAVGSVLGASGRGRTSENPAERNPGLPALQRQLKVDGDRQDVAAMAAMLGAASGLILVWDAKRKTISAKGPNGKKALSQEVADRLQQIIADTARDAEIHLGRTREGIHIGAFPTDFTTNPVQELRIDQILSLEKGAPGSGVSTLMHEIIENYEMQSHRDESFNDAFEASHRPAVKSENKILDQIQDARGETHHQADRRSADQGSDRLRHPARVLGEGRRDDDGEVAVPGSGGDQSSDRQRHRGERQPIPVERRAGRYAQHRRGRGESPETVTPCHTPSNPMRGHAEECRRE